MYYDKQQEWDDLFGSIPQIWRDWETCFAQHGMQCINCSWLKEHNLLRLWGRARKHEISLQDIAKHLGVLTEWHDSHDLLGKCKADLNAIFEQHGPTALRCTWLMENGHSGLYARMLRSNLTFEDFAQELQVSLQHSVLTKQAIRDGFDEVFAKWGHIPPAPFLIQNGYATLAGNYNRLGFTIDEIRKWYGVANERRCHLGICWASYGERLLSDFLTSCGITVQPGQWYPPAFQRRYKCKAKYDIHFVATQGAQSGQRINVEVWGGPRHSDRAKYIAKRKIKEEYHRGDQSFLGIEYDDVFHPARLPEIIEQHVDVKSRKEPEFACKFYAGSSWSMLDGVLPTAVNIYNRLGHIPPYTWFCKKNGRDVKEWEPLSWEWFLELARKHHGGIRNLRYEVQKVVDKLKR